MKTLLTLGLAISWPSLAIANNPASVAFERFSYEIKKSDVISAQQEAFRKYADDLFRAQDQPASWDQCWTSLRAQQGALNDCKPLGPVMARGGGTGGAE